MFVIYLILILILAWAILLVVDAPLLGSNTAIAGHVCQCQIFNFG